MKACLDCLPCLARNATELARRSARGDAALEGRIAAEGMRILGRAAEDGYPLPPPCYARQLIDNALAMCGGAVPDPWAEEKKKSTELALKLMERMGLFTNDNCHNCSPIANATCGAAFRAAFSRVDLIVAKGQANFETMSERTDKPIAFLFLAKCPVVCRESAS